MPRPDSMFYPQDREPDDPGATASWLQPEVEESTLERYLEVLRERFWIVALCVIVSTLAATVYVAAADKVYEAEADILVQPVPEGDSVLNGLGLLTDSGDPSRDTETIARLITTPDVAAIVKRKLQLPGTPRSVLGGVEAEPVAQSNLVAITVQSNDARDAQRRATGFGEAMVEDRTAQLHAQLDQVIERLRTRVDEAAAGAVPGQPVDPATAAVSQQLTELELLRGLPDPTIRLETPAELPLEAIAPRPLLAIGAGLLAGLILGLVGAFAFQVLDPRVRREQQLRGLTRLPLLARIPRENAAHRGDPLRPERLAPQTIEAYRTLRATLAASRGGKGGSRSILVTGASAAEGKSTTAINLAASLTLAGHSVILIEADLRRPSIGRALGITPTHDIMSVLLERTDLEDALGTTDAFGPNLQLLLADPRGGGASVGDGLFLPTAQRLVQDAKELADFVVIDSPPLTEVIDGLALAERADDVLLVVRLGTSRLAKVRQLGELLARHGIEPTGFAVVGVPASTTTSGYYVQDQEPSPGATLARR